MAGTDDRQSGNVSLVALSSDFYLYFLVLFPLIIILLTFLPRLRH